MIRAITKTKTATIAIITIATDTPLLTCSLLSRLDTTGLRATANIPATAREMIIPDICKVTQTRASVSIKYKKVRGDITTTWRWGSFIWLPHTFRVTSNFYMGCAQWWLWLGRRNILIGGDRKNLQVVKQNNFLGV